MTALEPNTRMTSTDLTATPTPSAVWTSAPAAPTAEAARQAMQVYQEISNALLTPQDVQEIRTRKGTSTFPKRSAFQKLANAYRVSTEIVKRELTHDDDGQLVRCDVVVRATHPDGRYSEGDGACSRDEERFKRGAEKIDHDLPATAVTRAKNRAISDLVAFGAVSAEEAEAGDPGGEPVRTELPAWAQPVSDVSGVAGSLVAVLKAAGVREPADAAMAIGEEVFGECDQTVPRAVYSAIFKLQAHINQERIAETPVEAAPVGAEALIEPEDEDTTTTNEGDPA